MRKIPPSLCARCKGYKRLCGLPYCPILERFRKQMETVSKVATTETVAGDTPPSVIVGEYGFPKKVNIFFAIPPEERGEKAKEHDNPPFWAQRRYSLRLILGLRAGMIAAKLTADVNDPLKLYEKEIALAAVSVKPVDSEAKLEEKPIPLLRFDGIVEPYSPSASASMLKIPGNPTLPRKLEKLVWDDVSAEQAVLELYNSGVDVYTIIRGFSLGLFGRTRSRHLVPTRWSITAVDQIISSRLLRRVRTYDTIDQYEVYHASYLGNHFTIILAPGAYEAEMIEVWHPLTPWTLSATEPVVYTVREFHTLKFSSMDGGYMAARLPIAEHLAARRRQARVIIVREVTRDYYAPVGNWHIRETVGRALKAGPIAACNTLNECLAIAADKLLSAKARMALRNSVIARKVELTRKLDEFLRR